MKKLVALTWKSLIRSERLVFIELPLVLIGILGAVLCEVFYAPVSGLPMGVLNLFNACTWFMSFVFVFILVQQFVQDIQDHSVILFEYLGFSRCGMVMSTMATLLLLLLPPIDIIILVGALLYRCSDHVYVGAAVLFLDLSVVNIVLRAVVLACVLKKTGTVTLVMYPVYLVCDLLNFFCCGMKNQDDGHRISTCALGRWIFFRDQPTVKNFIHNDNVMHAIIVSFDLIVLLFTVALFAQRKRVKR